MSVTNFAERDHTAIPGGNLLDLDYFGSIFRLYSDHQFLRPGHMSWMFQRNAMFTLPDTTCLTSFERGQPHYLYVGAQVPPPPQPEQQPYPEHEPRTYFLRGGRRE